MAKLFATTRYRTDNEADARTVVEHMLDNNQSVVKTITPCVILAEIDFNGVTGWFVIELRVNGYGPNVDIDFEGGEALAAWKQRAHECPAEGEVVDIECFTVETEYVRPPFNPNFTKYNPTSVGYVLS